MLTLLTPTGCRPEAWKHCIRLMQAQQYDGQVHWIVVDDGEIPQQTPFMNKPNWRVTVLRSKPYWQHGDNTQCRNLREGLWHVDADANLVIIEDDDWYHPYYLTAVAQWLKTADLVGESHARYYNVKFRKFRQLRNAFHASLCATAMKGAAISTFAKVVAKDRKFVDLELWDQFKGSKMMHPTQMVVGIKGLPGRAGIGSGHDKVFNTYTDESLKVLEGWIGDDVKYYE